MKRQVLLTVSGAIIGALTFATPASAMVLPRIAQPTELTVIVPAKQVISPPKVTMVGPGDTLTGIAARTETTWIDLAAFNHLTNPNLIFAGWRLQVPPANWKTPNSEIAALNNAVYGVLNVPNPPAATPTPQPASNATQTVVAPSGGFQACVMFRESTNGLLSSNLYGILPSTWTANGFTGSPYTASAAEQNLAFQTIYNRDGPTPWSLYDGC